MNEIRPSALAGAWYEGDPGALAASVDRHLAKGRPLSEIATQRPVAVIAPHAGHQYSGDAAGHIYRLIEGEAGRSIERVILIGPSHRTAFRHASVPTYSAYETPLGRVAVDTEIVKTLLEDPLFQTVEAAHRQEHCLEIQLPFLQRVLRHDFRIVPILISHMPSSDWKKIADALAPLIDDHTLLVASSDFTHFGQRFGYQPFREDVDVNLRRLDKGALEPMLALDAQALAKYKEKTDISVCGYQPIGIMLEMLRHPDLTKQWGGQPPEGRVLEYYRSADLTGDFDGSVSYAAVGFFRAGSLREGPLYPPALASVAAPGAGSSAADRSSANEKKQAEQDEQPAAMQLNAEEKRFLLELARRTVREIVETKKVAQVGTLPGSVSEKKLRSRCGVFVTLTKKGRLRGCIGSILGTEPLVEGVVKNAINAATRDPRFPAVDTGEIGELTIEISVLTPLKEVSGIAEIVVGRHGVILERSGRRAVFLPQVAPEQGWDRDTMLEHLSLKAGLAKDAWREKGTIFQVFEAFVFSEDEHAE
jgi:AmmeMemoRadiSam system protein B/AmmeMemoRadiSam system protein A